MKKLLNTLYVLTPETYLFCRNENICVQIEDAEKLCVPARHHEGFYFKIQIKNHLTLRVDGMRGV